MAHAENICYALFVERLQEAVRQGRVQVQNLAHVFCTDETRVQDWVENRDLPALHMVEPILKYIDSQAT